jgi:hypothetical protein
MSRHHDIHVGNHFPASQTPSRSCASTPYQSNLSRRESLKWFGLLATGSALVATHGCSSVLSTVTSQGHWPALDIKPVVANGYGKDPALVAPLETPWPRTLSAEQLTLVAVLSDYLVPREGDVPSATEVNVPDVVDEWVSAPYDAQQADRVTILHALAWIDDEASLRFGKKFAMLGTNEQTAILDDIAWYHEQVPAAFQRIAKAFDRFRNLVLAAFFCTPAGWKDIGYLGNVPIAGDYPGPTAEAKAHLDKVLTELGLSEFAYRG